MRFGLNKNRRGKIKTNDFKTFFDGCEGYKLEG
jgi:hypothetical protein